jgi:hypothetical protein
LFELESHFLAPTQDVSGSRRAQERSRRRVSAPAGTYVEQVLVPTLELSTMYSATSQQEVPTTSQPQVIQPEQNLL